MKKLCKVLVLNVLLAITLVGMIGCSSVEDSGDKFELKQFESEMKAKGYDYKIQQLEDGLLNAKSETMIIGDDLITIYSYKDNDKMEEDAKTISKDGCGINSGENAMEISWASAPHFYKKGNLIVNYVGENEKIISDLKEILGEQFAGKE